MMYQCKYTNENGSICGEWSPEELCQAHRAEPGKPCGKCRTAYVGEVCPKCTKCQRPKANASVQLSFLEKL